MTKAEQDEIIKRFIMDNSQSNLRDYLSSEANEHRTFLTNQMTLFIRYMGLFLVVASVVGALFIYKSLHDAQDSIQRYIAEARRVVEAEQEIMRAQLDGRIVDYQVRGQYRERIAGYISEYVADDAVTRIIEKTVNDSADVAAQEAVSEQMDAVISKRLRIELASLDDSSTSLLMNRALSETQVLKEESQEVRSEIEVIKTSLARLEAIEKAQRKLAISVAAMRTSVMESSRKAPRESAAGSIGGRRSAASVFDERHCYSLGGTVEFESPTRVYCHLPNGDHRDIAYPPPSVR